MSEALAAAPGKAVAEPQSIEPGAHFGKGERRMIRLWGDVMTRLMAADPGHFQWAIRQTEQPEAAPVGKGRRGNRRQGR